MSRPDPLKPALRPFLPVDTPMLAAIFVAAIQELTGDDYSDAQQEAWAAAAADETAFGKKLAGELTVIATVKDAPVGFAALKGADRIDMLYVHPSVAGQGVGAALCEAMERLAAARGTKILSADVSDNALDFFKKRGYVANSRNSVIVHGEWLGNTTMQKTLANGQAAGASQ